MNEKQRKVWERIRSRGKVRYVWMNWILRYGLTFTILTSLLQVSVPGNNPDVWSWIVIRLVSSFVVTLIGGSMYWEHKEVQFEREYGSDETVEPEGKKN